MNILKRITGWRWTAAIFTCFLCLSLGVAQAATPFFWDSIEVDMTLDTKGDLLVTETQKYVLTASHNNERYRYIPLGGIVGIRDVSVSENNEPLTVEAGVQNNNYWIRWQHPLKPPSAHTFVIQYRVVGGIQTKGNHSQLYWNALFSERSAPINRGKVTVHVPETLADKVKSFRGEGVGSRDRKLNPTTFEFVANSPLAPQQALNIRLEFPTSALATSQAQTDYWSEKPSVLAPLFRGAGLGIIVISSCVAIIAIRKRCPNCGQLALKRSSRVVQKATRYRQGKRDVRHTCQRCNYERRFNHTIPRKSSTASSAHGGWGGYSSGSDGGGGYSGGGDCGGGDCGGGG